jgi:hypothetical protein
MCCYRPAVCCICAKPITTGKPRRLEPEDVPVDMLVEDQVSYKAHEKCRLPNKCAWCGKSSTVKGKPMDHKPELWRMVSVGKGGWSRAPCASEKVHKECVTRIGKVISRGKQKAPSPSAEREEPATKKARKEEPWQQVVVEFKDLTSPLSPREEMAAYVLVTRLKHNSGEHATHSGGASILVGSRGPGSGGRKTQYIHCPIRVGTSVSTGQRAQGTVESVVKSQVTKVWSAKKILEQLARGRFGKENGLYVKPLYSFHSDELDVLKAELKLSGAKIIIFVRIMRNRHHIVFGQTVREHKQGIKDRRLDVKYTSELVEQEDGAMKRYFFSRVECVGDVLASRVALLDEHNVFQDLAIGDKDQLKFDVPFGSLFVSILVCKNNQTQTHTNTNRRFFLSAVR